MRIPSHLTEAEFVDTVNRVIAILAPSFVFGYYDYDDIVQHCWVEVIEKILPKYDESRRLDNFLYTSLRNRLINLWRDEFTRTDPPCTTCHESYRMGLAPHNGDYCSTYKVWLKRNSCKRSLAEPSDVETVSELNNNIKFVEKPSEAIDFAQLSAKIDAGLPAELRTTYKRMMAQERVSPAKREQVVRCVREILEGASHA